jgi:aliphatic sulfonates family ABC transporter substrate-binding protein
MPVLTLPRVDSLSVRAKALVFEDRESRALLARIQQVAPSDATILLSGETGTGKEIVARHVHALSARQHMPFVAVNCGAFAESLVESELFGHERGAFTGAHQSKVGWFEAARGGTLFLDEVGDLPPATQVKLLRVLQEGEVVRLGSRSPISIDVRLIAATNVDLQEAVSAGRFREDLYYRLHVAALNLLPLRERSADILPIAEYFLGSYSQRLGMETTPVLSADAVQGLLEHAWPGNIRQLENVIHHALLVCQAGEVRLADLRLQLPVKPAGKPLTAAGTELEAVLQQLFEVNQPNLFEHVEERLLRAAYAYCDRNQVHTARLLGISRNVVRARLIQLGEIAAVGRARELEPVAATTGAPPRRAARNTTWPPAGNTLRIGYQRYGLLPLVKASGKLESACEAQGWRVEWSEFDGGMQLIAALESHALGLGLVGEGPPVFAQAAQIPIVYLAAEAPAPEHEAIVVPRDSPIRSIGDLRGRTVLLTRGSNVHYFLIRALETAQLNYDDIRVAYATPDRAQLMFERALVDAWATWQPFLGSVQRECGARILRDASGLTTNTSYYIATRKLTEQNPELVATFLEQVNEVAQWAQANGEAAMTLLGSTLGTPRAVLKSALTQLRAPVPFGAAHAAAQQTIADTFHRLKLIAAPVQVEQTRWRPASRTQHDPGPFEAV